MIPYDKIFEMLLFILSFTLTKVQDHDKAVKRFRELLDGFERPDESVTLLEEADAQFASLSGDGDTDGQSGELPLDQMPKVL
jgi:hypothetical protein